jgi:Ser-tRNA(Ala) deacylase AlaX
LRELVTSVVSWQSAASLGEAERALFKAVLDNCDGAVATKETIFHPQGGGQPSDRGTITAEADSSGPSLDVKLVRKLPSGVILHLGSLVRPTAETATDVPAAPVFKEAQNVVLRVDDDLRNYHSRLHTAGHLIGLAVHQLAAAIGEVSDAKANHAPGSSYVEFVGLIGGEHKPAIQEAVDKMVAADRAVSVRWWDAEQVRERCTAVPDAVAFPPGEDLVRVVEVEGCGAYPCGGTHLPTTAAIGKVVIRKISRQKGISKISYEVAPSK